MRDREHRKQTRASHRVAGARDVTRRRFLNLTGAVAAGAALGRCTVVPRGRGPHGSDTVQLAYQDWGTQWFPGMAQEMLQRYHGSHPNTHVFYTPDPEPLDEAMIADFQAGTAPDVLAGCCDFFAAWAQDGYLMDLRPFVEADLDRALRGD